MVVHQTMRLRDGEPTWRNFEGVAGSRFALH